MKYESNTGWPSFFDHIKGHLETYTDLTAIPSAKGIQMCALWRTSWPPIYGWSATYRGTMVQQWIGVTLCADLK